MARVMYGSSMTSTTSPTTTVHVVGLSGRSFGVFEVHGEDTIAMLKNRIQSAWRIPFRCQATFTHSCIHADIHPSMRPSVQPSTLHPFTVSMYRHVCMHNMCRHHVLIQTYTHKALLRNDLKLSDNEFITLSPTTSSDNESHVSLTLAILSTPCVCAQCRTSLAPSLPLRPNRKVWAPSVQSVISCICGSGAIPVVSCPTCYMLTCTECFSLINDRCFSCDETDRESAEPEIARHEHIALEQNLTVPSSSPPLPSPPPLPLQWQWRSCSVMDGLRLPLISSASGLICSASGGDRSRSRSRSRGRTCQLP